MAKLHLAQEIFNLIYPVGSIYISTTSINPSTYFGGTWEQIKDRFLLACGNTYSNGSTGGEANHKLTEAELPSHHHYIAGDPNGKNDNPDYNNPIGWWATSSFTDLPYAFRQGYKRGWVGQSSSCGSDHAHNNMPPYLAVYIWKRTK